MFQGMDPLRRLCWDSLKTPEFVHAISNHNISYDARLRSNNYAIYPGVSNDTYIYEQSTCSKSDIFSNSEYDALSAATFSPAMSTDSTLTIRSPAAPEHFLEEHVRRPATPAAPTSYAAHGSMVPQPPAIPRTTPNHYAQESLADTPGDRRSRVTSIQGHPATPMHHSISSAGLNELKKISLATVSYNGQLPSHIPEYAPSTISELEVDERDRIAKINAEYNAVSSSSSSSYYSNDNAVAATESAVRRTSTSPPNQRSSDSFTRTIPSQPLHPNMHFPTKPDDFNPTFNSNPTPSIFSTKDGSPPLVERVPSQVQFPSTTTQSGQFLPAQAQDDWNRDGVYHSEHARVPLHGPLPPATSNHTFDNSSASLPRSTQATYAAPQETMSVNEHRPLPVPPPETPRQRSTTERRPSVVGPRPDANVLKATSDARYRNQTAREYSYDHSEVRHDASHSPPRGSTLQPSSRDLSSHAAMVSEMRRDTTTPAPPNDYRRAPPTRRDSYAGDPQKPPIEPRPCSIDTRDVYTSLTSSPTQLRHSPSDLEAFKPPPHPHLPPAAFTGPTEIERSNDRIRTRSISFSNSTRPDLSSLNLGQHLSSSQQCHSSNVGIPDPRRVSEQVKHVHTSPLRTQEASVHHSDYVESERRNDVRGSNSHAVYNNQPATFNRDTHSSQRQNLPVGHPPSKSNDRSPPHQTINSRNGNATQEVPSSRSRSSYVEVPAAHSNNGLPTRDTTSYDKSPMPVKTGSNGGYSSSSNSTDQGYVPPEQPTQRRYSDGDKNPPPRPVQVSGRSSAPLVRSVRWTENLICPSPIFPSQRRKGWFNRRG